MVGCFLDTKVREPQDQWLTSWAPSVGWGEKRKRRMNMKVGQGGKAACTTALKSPPHLGHVLTLQKESGLRNPGVTPGKKRAELCWGNPSSQNCRRFLEDTGSEFGELGRAEPLSHPTPKGLLSSLPPTGLLGTVSGNQRSGGQNTTLWQVAVKGRWGAQKRLFWGYFNVTINISFVKKSSSFCSFYIQLTSLRILL